MNAEKFVASWKAEKFELLRIFHDSNIVSSTAKIIEDLSLSPHQAKKFHLVLVAVLTDTMYTLLLGLDGEATIGGEQVSYNILDESDNESSGQIEEVAWQQFQEHT